MLFKHDSGSVKGADQKKIVILITVKDLMEYFTQPVSKITLLLYLYMIEGSYKL